MTSVFSIQDRRHSNKLDKAKREAVSPLATSTPISEPYHLHCPLTLPQREGILFPESLSTRNLERKAATATADAPLVVTATATADAPVVVAAAAAADAPVVVSLVTAAAAAATADAPVVVTAVAKPVEQYTLADSFLVLRV